MSLLIEVEDKKLVEEAQTVGQHKTEAEAVVAALREYVTRHQQKKSPGANLQQWVDELYGKQKPNHVVKTLIAERRQEAAQE